MWGTDRQHSIALFTEGLTMRSQCFFAEEPGLVVGFLAVLKEGLRGQLGSTFGCPWERFWERSNYSKCFKPDLYKKRLDFSRRF